MTGNSTYGFVHFLDLMSAVMAKRRMDGTMLGISRLKVLYFFLPFNGIHPHTSVAINLNILSIHQNLRTCIKYPASTHEEVNIT